MKLDTNITLPEFLTKKKVHYPEKTTLNLAFKEKKISTSQILSVGTLIIVLLLAVVLKFGVYDQLHRLSVAEGEYSEIHEQYVSYYEMLNEYDSVVMEYRTYATGSGNVDAEGNPVVLVSRRDVLDLIEQKMMTKGTVNGITITGNEVQVVMSGMNLSEVSAMFKDLRQSDLVSGTALNVAETEDGSLTKDLEFTVTISVKSPVDEETVDINTGTETESDTETTEDTSAEGGDSF